jgi:hypothetical protein
MTTRSQRRISYLFVLFGLASLLPITAWAQANSEPVTTGGAGAFTDYGYNPRAEAMGGAMVAVTGGEFQYAGYNPALSSFQDDYRATFSYAAMSLDRSLNFVAIGGPLVAPSKDTISTETQSPADLKKNAASTIHVQLGWLRAGVSNIQAYDFEGDKIGQLSSSENEILGNASVRITKKFGLGFSARFYHSTLPAAGNGVSSISSGGFGLDIGAVYAMRENLTLGFAIEHLAAKYTWDSSPLYGQLGTTTTDYFPITFKFGAAYFPTSNLLLSADLSYAKHLYDSQDLIAQGTTTSALALGIEYQLISNLYIRGGVKGFDLVNSLGQEVSESLGFGYTFVFEGLQPSLTYAIIFDPVTAGQTQMVSVGVKF